MKARSVWDDTVKVLSGGLPRALRRAFLSVAYGWLYGPGAFSYEAVAAAVSLGEWGAWRRAALPHVRGEDVLELGFGTGRLAAELAVGHWYVGLDPSPWMHRRTRGFLWGRLGPGAATACLVRGRSERLPFGGERFDTVIATFPTRSIFDDRTHREVWRVLRPGGRLIVVLGAAPRPTGLLGRLAGLALAAGSSPSDSVTPLSQSLSAVGFVAADVEMQHARSVSAIVVATRPAAGSVRAPGV